MLPVLLGFVRNYVNHVYTFNHCFCKSGVWTFAARAARAERAGLRGMRRLAGAARRRMPRTNQHRVRDVWGFNGYADERCRPSSVGIDMMCDVMNDTELHLKACLGYKMTGTTTKLDGTEDDQMRREAEKVLS